jgi:acetyl esterase/lipase
VLVATIFPTRLAIAATPPVRDVHYGLAANQTLDVWPSSSPNSPLVVMIHAGGWWTGFKNQYDYSSSRLQDQGFTVVNINYRLASKNYLAFPMEINDTNAATNWAINHASQYNANPKDVFILGFSAGGHLAAMTAEQLNTTSPHKIKAIISLSGVTDFVGLAKDYKAGTLTPSINNDVILAMGCSLSTCTTAVEKKWSPAWNLTPTNCPTNSLIFGSTNEILPIDQVNTMVSALTKNACKVKKVVLNGNLHAVEYWPQVETTIINFIKTH